MGFSPQEPDSESSGRDGAVYLSVVPSFLLDIFRQSLKYDSTVIQNVLLPLLFVSHVDIIIYKQNETSQLEGNCFAVTENLKQRAVLGNR